MLCRQGNVKFSIEHVLPDALTAAQSSRYGQALIGPANIRNEKSVLKGAEALGTSSRSEVELLDDANNRITRLTVGSKDGRAIVQGQW